MPRSKNLVWTRFDCVPGENSRNLARCKSCYEEMIPSRMQMHLELCRAGIQNTEPSSARGPSIYVNANDPDWNSKKDNEDDGAVRTSAKRTTQRTKRPPLKLMEYRMPLDCRYWTKEFTTEFLEQYKKCPCLWKVKSEAYMNKTLKNAAYDKLVELCKKIYPQADRNYVVRKIQNFRGSFRKEVKRVWRSRKNATSQEEVHVPSLWYYDKLLFTLHQEEPARRIDDEHSHQSFDDEEILEDEGKEHDDHQKNENASQVNPQECRYWTKEFITEFLELYKSMPCLWNVKCQSYTNRPIKNAAYSKLTELCRKFYRDATQDYVVKRIQSFRGAFRKERKKVMDSKKNGTTYVPSLWYYNLLLFTVDQEDNAQSLDEEHARSFDEECAESFDEEYAQSFDEEYARSFDDANIFDGSNDEEHDAILVKEEPQVNPQQCRYWTKEFITEFLELYKSMPCLWNVKCQSYTNRTIKNTAYNKLTELCRKFYRDATRDYVVKKIQSFRTTFRKERNKVMDSKKNGTTYVPSLWYYNLLLFTVDQEDNAQSLDEKHGQSFDDANMFDGFDDEEYDDILVKEEPQVAKDVESNITFVEIPNEVEKRKIPYKTEKGSKFLKRSMETMENLEEYDAAAISWSKKLKRMDPTQAIYSELLVNKILSLGLLNQLEKTTDITNNGISNIFMGSTS